jgi:endoglucanase
MGIAIDVTIAADVPHCEPGNPALGKGPCIKVRDGSLIAHPKVIDAMKKAAARAGIEVQMEVLRHAGTDAGAIQLVRSGVPAGCLSIACRYVHSPSEMVDINDVSESVRLLSTSYQIQWIYNRLSCGSKINLRANGRKHFLKNILFASG